MPERVTPSLQKLLRVMFTCTIHHPPSSPPNRPKICFLFSFSCPKFQLCCPSLGLCVAFAIPLPLFEMSAGRCRVVIGCCRVFVAKSQQFGIPFSKQSLHDVISTNVFFHPTEKTCHLSSQLVCAFWHLFYHRRDTPHSNNMVGFFTNVCRTAFVKMNPVSFARCFNHFKIDTLCRRDNDC